MAMQQRRFPVWIVLVTVAVLALAVWLGFVVFGSDETTPVTTGPAPADTSTTAPDSPTTSAPTSTTTTVASTTTSTSASTTTSTPSTTTAEAAGPGLVEVEVEEDLTRLFPVAAGWIVASAEDTLTVGVSVGSEGCYGLASAEVEENPEQVNVTMTAGFRPDPTGCGDVGPHWTYTFPLESPLGNRPVVDTHTGQELGTEPPDPEEG